MSDISRSISQFASLEDMAGRNTPVHKLHPAVKVITTLFYLILVISFYPEQVSGLVPFIFYPVILMVLGDIPILPLLQRFLIALPFALFAGISNLIFSRTTAFTIGNIVVTDGMISFTSVLLKTILTVMMVLILIATTRMNDLIYVLILFRIPSIIVIQLIMTYRYISVLLNEASVMYHAYILRTPGEKGIRFKDMGPFLGQLIVRSFDRADRIYKAMKCKGFEGHLTFSVTQKITIGGWIFLFITCSLLVTMRFINISNLIGKLFV